MKVHMCHQLLIIAALLHSTAAVVDCRIACQLCKEKSEHRMLLEVHCALCKECKLRRQEKLQVLQSIILQNNTQEPYVDRFPPTLKAARRIIDTPSFDEDYSEDCPTPPPCDSAEEVEFTTEMLRRTTTRTTTTKSPCLPVKCRKKSKTTTSTACAMPCVPLCPYPCPLMPYTSTTLAPNIVPQKDVKTPDYYVVYVGLPKNVVMETIETE